MNREEQSRAPAAPEHSNVSIDSPIGAPINRSRRRLVTSVAGGTGIVLASASKTALGTGVCKSPSATMSGNISPRAPGSGSCSGGRSPGFWKVPQKFNYWPGGNFGPNVPTFITTVDLCSSGMKGLTLATINTQGLLAKDVLSGAGILNGKEYGVWAVLAFPTSFANGQLARHLLAAWLNASYWPTEYPITKAQILAMWDATKGGGTWCATGVTCTTPWKAADVIAYISGMYDINADVGADPDLCTT